MDTNTTKPNAPGNGLNQLLRINDVVALTTLSRSCLNLWVAQGRFPRPIALSNNVKVWRTSDVSDWIDGHFETSEEPTARTQESHPATAVRLKGVAR